MIPLNSRLDGLQRSGIRRYTNLAKTVPGCVMLTIGEPDGDTPEAIKAAALTALFQNHTHYAPNQGLEALRSAIAEAETRRGMVCTPEQVLVTVGATGALYTALTGILNPGEEVVIPTPAFPLYETIVTAAGGKPVLLDMKKLDFQLTKEALAQVITLKTKAIVLNSPNNPTGAVLSEESLAAVKKAVLGKPILPAVFSKHPHWKQGQHRLPGCIHCGQGADHKTDRQYRQPPCEPSESLLADPAVQPLFYWRYEVPQTYLFHCF